jgi:G-patch domain
MFSHTSFAHKQLQKLGWTPDKGLGRHGTGRTDPVAVSKRRNEAGGLGLEGVTGRGGGSTCAGGTSSSEWWKDALGATLARLETSGASTKDKSKKGKKKKGAKRKRSDRTEEEGNDTRDDAGAPAASTTMKRVRHYTDEELFVMAGKSRFGMRAAPKSRQLAKWRRTNDTFVGAEGDDIGDNTDKSKAVPTATATATTTKIAADRAEADKESKKTKKRRRKDGEEPIGAATTAAVAVTEPSSSSEEGGNDDAAEGAVKGKQKKKRDKKKRKDKKTDGGSISQKKKEKKAKSKE